MSQFNYDWDDIKTRYIAGDSAYQIEKLPDTPSRQAICKRAKAEDWDSLRVDEKYLPDQPAFKGLDGVDHLDERKRAVLEGLRRWATYKDAAALAGVDESTVRRWRQDERFARLCRAALAVNKLEMTEVIRKAAERGDWKAALALLEKHPMTRDDFGQGPSRTSINTIKIGHLIQRDPAHRVPHLIDQDDGPVMIEESDVEPEPAVDPEKIEREKPIEVEPEKDESQEPEVQSEKIERNEPVEIEPIESEKPVETQPIDEPVQARRKFNINGVEICPDCLQVPHPGYPHLCLAKNKG